MESQAKSIHWQSIQPPGAIEIREFVKQRGEELDLYRHGRLQPNSGSGTSKFISK